MINVRKLKDAKKWVNEHLSEPLTCINNKKELIVDSYEKAAIFFCGEENVLFGPEKYLEKIKRLEKEIETNDVCLRKMKNVTDTQLIVLEIAKEKVNELIHTYERLIKSNEEEIKSILKRHPEVEPLYIMHQITK